MAYEGEGVELKIDNMENYRICSEPFASPEEANEVLRQFFKELYELRVKHKIHNLTVVVGDSYGTGEFFCSAHFGNPLQAESMAAWRFGEAQAERQAATIKLIGEGGGVKKPRSKR